MDAWKTGIGLLFAISLMACGDSGQPVAGDAGTPPGGLTPEQAARVVARVGDETITLGDYAAALDRMDTFDRLRYQTVEKRRELLKEMVDLELLAIEARRRGLDKKPEAQAAMRQVLRDALLSEAHKALPTPTEIPASDVRAYYDAHLDEYREPERRRVSAIVMADETKAKDVLAEAQKATEPAAWGELFAKHSETAPSDKTKKAPLDLAGELGMVGPPEDAKGQNPKVPEAVRAAAFKIEKVGVVHGELVSSGGKFYIVKLSGRTPPHERSYAEAEKQIRTELLKVRLKELEAKLEQELREKYKVEIDEASLAQVSLSGASPTPPEIPPTAPSAVPSAPPSPSQ